MIKSQVNAAMHCGFIQAQFYRYNKIPHGSVNHWPVLMERSQVTGVRDA